MNILGKVEQSRGRVDVRASRLEDIVERMGEAVIATTTTVDRLADRMDALATQVQQQGYQIFALSEAVQTLAENQDSNIAKMEQLIDALKRLVATIDDTEPLE